MQECLESGQSAGQPQNWAKVCDSIIMILATLVRKSQ